jgi:serine/threonine protein kinase
MRHAHSETMNTGMQTMDGGSAVALAGFAEGDVLGSWRVEGQLGHGGMSTVYAVVHTEIGKHAALKVVHAHVLSSTFTAECVLLEAQVVNRIGHDGIVDIFEAGKLPDGRPYLVMERLDGQSLAQRCDAGRIEVEDAIQILLQTCSAVAAAHAAGVVHCDLKPDNVFLTAETPVRTKVLDWGISKVLSADPETFGDLIIGTPLYLSPEQATGGAITQATDIYSLGVIAYEMFLEHPPFEADTNAELMMMHLRNAPKLPRECWPEIPTRLENLLLAMLAKTPKARPSALEVTRVLASVRDEIRRIGRPAPTGTQHVRSLARTQLVPRLAPKRTRRSRAVFATLGALSLLAALAVMKLAEPESEIVSAAPVRATVASTAIVVPPPVDAPTTIVAVTVPKIAVTEKPARRKRAARSAAPVIAPVEQEVDIFQWAMTIVPITPATI